MAEDDTLFYNDEAPEPNARDTVEVKGPWGTLTLRPSPAFAEELAQLSHIGWDGIGSPERSLEGAAVQFVQSVQTMVRIEGRDPERSIDLGDPETNPYLRRHLDAGGLGGLSVFGGGGLTLQQVVRMLLDEIPATEADGDPETSPHSGNFRWHPKREGLLPLHLVGGLMADAKWYDPDSNPDPTPTRPDGLTDGDIEDIVDASPGPDLR